MKPKRQPPARALPAWIAPAGLVLLVLVTSHSSYVIDAEFYDAGQLVKGDLVTVAGHRVGSVGAVKLTGSELADIELDISDSSITPLRRGTIATIGQLSLTGVANRFVGLSLGAGAPIASGGVLGPTQTRGIVDLDTLLDALTPRVRAALQGFLKSGAYLVAQASLPLLGDGASIVFVGSRRRPRAYRYGRTTPQARPGRSGWLPRRFGSPARSARPDPRPSKDGPRGR